MKFLDLLRLSSSSLWKRKVRTLLTVLGVTIGVASIVVMVSLGLGLNKSSMEEMESYGSLTAVTVNMAGGNGFYSSGMAIAESTSSSEKEKEEKRLDDELVETLKALPHVNLVSPVLNVDVIAKSGIYEGNFRVQGMTAEAFEAMKIPLGEGNFPQKDAEKLEFFYGNMVLQSFSNSRTGSYPYYEKGELPPIDLMKDPIFVIFDTNAYYNSKYSSTQGSSASVKTPPPKKYLISTCGMVEGGPEDWSRSSYEVYCDIDALKTELKRIFKNKAIPGQPTTKSGKPYKEIYYSQIYVDVDDMENVSEVQSAINAMGYQASSNAEWVQAMQTQYGYVQLVLGGIGAVSLLVAAIGITNTMMMSIYERTKEIGIMKVLGCDLRNIQMMFLMEAGFIGLIGGLVGLLFSFGVSIVINKIVASMGNMMTLSYIPPWLALLSLIFAILVGMVAGFFPSLRAMRLSPLAAIRNE